MNIKNIIKKRWKFYLVTYFIGYLISLLSTGIPNLYYLIPIKLSALAVAIGIGNGLYHASKGMPVYEYPIKGLKYLAVIIIVMVVFGVLRLGLLKLGVDITPLLGFEI